ncbi:MULTISPECIES: FitA-like ribbon-helix-helix domain-containing protein [Dermacoccus]|uniref:FitA-like ribbon-helix-helix domain-containing protein n=1 Tax=Dermacoccus TaxID=57495 RepID=UPI00384D4436
MPDVDEVVHERLRRQAAEPGRSVEAEVRAILAAATHVPEKNFLQTLRERTRPPTFSRVARRSGESWERWMPRSPVSLWAPALHSPRAGFRRGRRAAPHRSPRKLVLRSHSTRGSET